MRRIFAAVVLLCLVAMAEDSFAGDRGTFRYSGYSGGMCLHAGYIPGNSFAVVSADGLRSFDKHSSGLTTGIGGMVKLRFGKHLRLGSEGYASTLKYDNLGSYVSIGWGGVLADWIWVRKGVSPFVGVTFGGGSAKNLTLTEGAPVDFVAENNASYRKYAFLTAVPFVGIELPINTRMALVFKVDYMFDVSGSRPDFPSGPRAYVGFCFGHSK